MCVVKRHNVPNHSATRNSGCIHPKTYTMALTHPHAQATLYPPTAPPPTNNGQELE
jgi:hypothetical protein